MLVSINMRQTICLVLVFATTYTFGQNNIEKKITLTGIEKIVGNFQWGDVTLKNYEGSELIVEGDVSINLGENNDAFSLETKAEGNVLEIHASVEDFKSLPSYLVIDSDRGRSYRKIEKTDDLDWKKIRDEFGSGQSYSMGPLIEISLTILVPKKLALVIETEYGSMEAIECQNPMDLKSKYGHLMVNLPARMEEDCQFESTYSFVDVSCPPNAGYNLLLETNYGQVYSNLDLNIDKKGSVDKIFESKIIGTLNNGGSPLQIKATYSDIYLRMKT